MRHPIFKKPNGTEFTYYTNQANPFCSGLLCKHCNLDREKGDLDCYEFIERYPEEAAKCMGYDFVGWQPDNIAPAETVEGRPPHTRESILDDAKRCVCGDRDTQYGSPEASFEAIADLWGSYLWNKHDLGHKGLGKNFISPEDVAAMMVLFKMARVATGSYKADSWIDAAGYAACGGEIGGSHG